MEFRKMRRNRQELTQEECVRILQKNTAGTLAVLGDGGYPYAVPLSYVYEDGKLWFHCAVSGHKLDAIRSCEKVSFCVIDQDQVEPFKYTTYFRSVIAFGRARILKEQDQIRSALERLACKYAPKDSPSHREKEIENGLGRLCMVEIAIEHMSGKQARELMSGGQPPFETGRE